MKKRIAKKWAKAFMTGRKKFPVRQWTHVLSTDGDYVVKVEFALPGKVLRDVHDMAFAFGWDGCHWDAPELIGYYDQDGWHPNNKWVYWEV